MQIKSKVNKSIKKGWGENSVLLSTEMKWSYIKKRSEKTKKTRKKLAQAKDILEINEGT